MLDIKWIRDNPEALKIMLANRRSKLDVAPVHELDAQRRKLLSELEQLQSARNKSADQIGKLKAQKQDATAALK
jgi:seryl-tRNA synthetase